MNTIDTTPTASEYDFVSKLATQREIAGMSDVQAITKIDELRAAAREAGDAGLTQPARALYVNACDIAENNLIGTDVIAEYADFLEGIGMPEFAAEYRTWHQEFTDVLASYGLPVEGYEDRLRAEAAQGQHRDSRECLSMVVDNVPRRERLAEAASQARSIAGESGTRENPRAILPSREHPQA